MEVRGQDITSTVRRSRRAQQLGRRMCTIDRKDESDFTRCGAFQRQHRDLLELADWLAALGITHVAMEATGIYWKPIWHILEGRFELVLANACAHSQCSGSQERCQRRRCGFFLIFLHTA